MRFGACLARVRRRGAAAGPWFIGLVLAALTIAPARAVIVAPTPMVRVDISGSYVPLRSIFRSRTSLFASDSFDFSVLLPATMTVTYSTGGGSAYTYAGTFAGIYTDGAVSTAFSALPTSNGIGSQSSGAGAGKPLYPTVRFAVPVSIGSQSGGAGAGKALSTIEFHFFNLLSQGDSFDILAALTTPEWTVSNPGADGTLTLDRGRWQVPSGQATYTPSPSDASRLRECTYWNRIDTGTLNALCAAPFSGQLAIPEPTSMTTFGVGALALVGFVRRRRTRVLTARSFRRSLARG